MGAVGVSRIYSAGPFAQFALGDANMFKFMSPSATNLTVSVFCTMGLLLVILSVIWRYLHHRATLRYFREKGMRDFNQDGTTDSFADKFLDDL